MSTSAKVVARLVDGGAIDFEFPSEFFVRLDALEGKGLRGKKLIDALITDDLGTAPK